MISSDWAILNPFYWTPESERALVLRSSTSLLRSSITASRLMVLFVATLHNFSRSFRFLHSFAHFPTFLVLFFYFSPIFCHLFSVQGGALFPLAPILALLLSSMPINNNTKTNAAKRVIQSQQQDSLYEWNDGCIFLQACYKMNASWILLHGSASICIHVSLSFMTFSSIIHTLLVKYVQEVFHNCICSCITFIHDFSTGLIHRSFVIPLLKKCIWNLPWLAVGSDALFSYYGCIPSRHVTKWMLHGILLGSTSICTYHFHSWLPHWTDTSIIHIPPVKV